MTSKFEPPTPRVSILLPVRDAAATLPVCFRSLTRQTEERWECVVVDDIRRDAFVECPIVVSVAGAGPRGQICQALVAMGFRELDDFVCGARVASLHIRRVGRPVRFSQRWRRATADPAGTSPVDIAACRVRALGLRHTRCISTRTSARSSGPRRGPRGRCREESSDERNRRPADPAIRSERSRRRAPL